MTGGVVDPPPPPQPAAHKLPAIHSHNAARRLKLIIIGSPPCRDCRSFPAATDCERTCRPLRRTSAVLFNFCAEAIVSRREMVSKSFSGFAIRALPPIEERAAARRGIRPLFPDISSKTRQRTRWWKRRQAWRETKGIDIREMHPKIKKNLYISHLIGSAAAFS